MRQLSSFFGQIIRKIDLDFLNLGNRQAINETHIDLSNQLGGIVSGLKVSQSQDGYSLFISTGTFYNGGLFNPQNGQGGGEKAQIYNNQTITSLTSTGGVGNNQTYLLVYAKTVAQNTDPNPNSPNVVYSAKNIQTGENQPVRSYVAGVVIVSNPITISEVNNFAGVPLALVQVDPNNKIVPNGIDLSVRRNYTLGGAIDIVTNKIIDSAVPDQFLTDRMFKDDQISATKFADSVITSPKLAIYDGSSSNYVASGSTVVAGSGVGTVHLKDEAVTEAKLNYSGSVANFSTRNRLINSSFEFSPSSGPSPITGWTITTGTNFTNTVTIDSNNSKYGFKSVQLLAGAVGGTMQSAGIEQVVYFGDNLRGKPISAFVYVKPATSFNLAAIGTTGIKGKLDFYSDEAAATSPVKTIEFDAYSGTSTDWRKLETSAPIIPDFDATTVKTTIYGAFTDRVFVDGVFLGETSLIPEWDVCPQEQVNNQIDANFVISGQFKNNRIGVGAIQTTNILNADSSQNFSPVNVGIQGSQIEPLTITGGAPTSTSRGGNIGYKTITAYNIDPSVLAIPPGAIIMWDDKFSNGTSVPTNGCPSGWTDISSRLSGRFPLAINSSAPPIQIPGTASTSKAIGNVIGDGRLGVNDVVDGNHYHTKGGGNFNTRAISGGSDLWDYTSTNGAHSHEEVVPYYTMRFCQKD